MVVEVAAGRFGIRFALNEPNGRSTPAFEQIAPMAIEVVSVDDISAWLTGGYTDVFQDGTELICGGWLTSPDGSRFHVIDRYTPHPPEGFELNRLAKVDAKGTHDLGFSSRFSVNSLEPLTTRDCDILMPGVWYGQNQHVPATAIGSHIDDRNILVREDRLPLPMAMLRARATGVTLSLLRVGGTPTTFAGEDGLKRVTDARMQFGSVGFENTGHLQPTFLFPGTEGERTYLMGPSSQNGRWAYRSHPITVGFMHEYRLLIRLGHTQDFAAALRTEWNAAYNRTAPAYPTTNLNRVYKSGMELLSNY